MRNRRSERGLEKLTEEDLRQLCRSPDVTTRTKDRAYAELKRRGGRESGRTGPTDTEGGVRLTAAANPAARDPDYLIAGWTKGAHEACVVRIRALEAELADAEYLDSVWESACEVWKARAETAEAELAEFRAGDWNWQVTHRLMMKARAEKAEARVRELVEAIAEYEQSHPNQDTIPVALSEAREKETGR